MSLSLLLPHNVMRVRSVKPLTIIVKIRNINSFIWNILNGTFLVFKVYLLSILLLRFVGLNWRLGSCFVCCLISRYFFIFHLIICCLSINFFLRLFWSILIWFVFDSLFFNVIWWALMLRENRLATILMRVSLNAIVTSFSLKFRPLHILLRR
jgi:hypothetical protein